MEYYTATEYYIEIGLAYHMHQIITFTLTGFGVTLTAGLITWTVALGVRSLLKFIRG